MESLYSLRIFMNMSKKSDSLTPQIWTRNSPCLNPIAIRKSIWMGNPCVNTDDTEFPDADLKSMSQIKKDETCHFIAWIPCWTPETLKWGKSLCLKSAWMVLILDTDSTDIPRRLFRADMWTYPYTGRCSGRNVHKNVQSSNYWSV